MTTRPHLRILSILAIAVSCCWSSQPRAAQGNGPKEDLSAIATAAYKTLNEVTTRGLDESASDIEKIIADHKRLAQSTDARERYLSVVLADSVAHALFYEIRQADYARRGIQEHVSPPVVPFEKATAVRLWKENMPKFEPLVQRILKEQRTTSDSVTSYLAEHSSMSDIQKGKLFGQNPPLAVQRRLYDLKDEAKLSSFIRKNPAIDEQIAYTLSIWQSFRDLSIIVDLYEKGELPGGSEAIQKTAKEAMAQYPHKRVDDGMEADAFKVWLTYESYYPEMTSGHAGITDLGPAYEYDLNMAFRLAPFMNDTSVFPKLIQKVISKLDR